MDRSPDPRLRIEWAAPGPDDARRRQQFMEWCARELVDQIKAEQERDAESQEPTHAR